DHGEDLPPRPGVGGERREAGHGPRRPRRPAPPRRGPGHAAQGEAAQAGGPDAHLRHTRGPPEGGLSNCRLMESTRPAAATSNGAAKVVLYDARRSSPTKGLVQELFLGEVNRGLLLIPAGVFHAVVNIGQVPARFVNMPTRPYRHERPDKYRLTHDTVHIPYEL